MPTKGVEDEEGKNLKLNFSSLEALLASFHRLSSIVPSFVREVAGLFVVTGQPADFKSAVLDRKKDTTDRLKALGEHAVKYITQLRQVGLFVIGRVIVRTLSFYVFSHTLCG